MWLSTLPFMPEILYMELAQHSVLALMRATCR